MRCAPNEKTDEQGKARQDIIEKTRRRAREETKNQDRAESEDRSYKDTRRQSRKGKRESSSSEETNQKKQGDQNIPKRIYTIVEHATNANNKRQAETTKEDEKTKRTTQN